MSRKHVCGETVAAVSCPFEWLDLNNILEDLYFVLWRRGIIRRLQLG